jgi:uncharacterized OB-fold protein
MTNIVSQAPPTTYFHLATDRWSEPFWTATTQHRLEIPRCTSCRRFRMPPSPFCPSCQSQEQEWVSVSGAGTVYSFTLITNPPFPEAADHLPYAPALVELDDAPGVRLVSAVVDAPLDRIAIGSRVSLVWQDLPDGVTLPRFKLTDPDPAAAAI